MTLPAVVYRAGQALLAPGAYATITATLRSWSAVHRVGDVVLDVGCGPRSFLCECGVRPVGVDIARGATRAFTASGGSAVCASAPSLPFPDGTFDSAWCFGLLHHLGDTDAVDAVLEMQRITKSGGHAVVFDGVRPDERGAVVARVVRRFDRGRWMRARGNLLALLERTGEWSTSDVRYSSTGLDGVMATWTSP